MNLTIYLAGEIHNDWRTSIRNLAESNNLPIVFVGPMENHDLSDSIGENIYGPQANPIQRDETASSINNLRTQILLSKSDLVIAWFGKEYKQWNTAMDASAALALGKPLIIVRPSELHHPLKELSRKANATVETSDQVIEILKYIFS